jgi:hypothetical protein
MPFVIVQVPVSHHLHPAEKSGTARATTDSNKTINFQLSSAFPKTARRWLLPELQGWMPIR